MKDTYKFDKEFHNGVSQAMYLDHATRVIMNFFGDAKLTRFELYQTIHNCLPHLKHIVHNRAKRNFVFLFDEEIKGTITIDVQVTPVEDIDIPKNWTQEINWDSIPNIPGKFATSSPVWNGVIHDEQKCL